MLEELNELLGAHFRDLCEAVELIIEKVEDKQVKSDILDKIGKSLNGFFDQNELEAIIKEGNNEGDFAPSDHKECSDDDTN